MYAGRVVCCLLVSHGDYADGTDRQSDGRQTVTFTPSAIDAARVITLNTPNRAMCFNYGHFKSRAFFI